MGSLRRNQRKSPEPLKLQSLRRNQRKSPKPLKLQSLRRNQKRAERSHAKIKNLAKANRPPLSKEPLRKHQRKDNERYYSSNYSVILLKDGLFNQKKFSFL